MNRKEKGITLISLIITTIVVLIIAGISIGGLTGSKGTIRESNEAKNKTEKESLIEKIEADLRTEKIKTGKTPDKEKLISIIEEKGYGIVNADNNSFKASDEEDEEDILFSSILGWTEGDFTKIYNYFYGKTYNECGRWDNDLNKYIYYDNTELGIKGGDITTIGGTANSSEEYTYIKYKKNYYVFDYDLDIEKVTNVTQINVDINTPGEYGEGERKILVTADGLLHCNYEGPATYLDNDNNEFTGYCAYDDDGCDRFYNTSWSLIREVYRGIH